MMQVTKVWWDGEKLMAEPIDPTAIYQEPALAEQPAQQQEPVAPKCGAIIEVFGHDWRLDYMSLPVGKHKLYTQQYTYTAPQPAQPSKPWVGLTEPERLACYDLNPARFASAIEAKLKEKNA